MHNIKANFDKIIKDEINKKGNYPRRGSVPKFSDIEVIALSLTAECLGIDSENFLFSKLKNEYTGAFKNLSSRRQYNNRRKLLSEKSKKRSKSFFYFFLHFSQHQTSKSSKTRQKYGKNSRKVLLLLLLLLQFDTLALSN